MEQDEQQEQLGPCEAGRPDVDTLIGGTRSRLPAASPGAKPSPLPPIPHPPAEQALGHSICQASQHGVSASEGRRKRDGQKACAQWGCYQKISKNKTHHVATGTGGCISPKEAMDGQGSSHRPRDAQRDRAGSRVLWWRLPAPGRSSPRHLAGGSQVGHGKSRLEESTAGGAQSWARCPRSPLPHSPCRAGCPPGPGRCC